MPARIRLTTIQLALVEAVMAGKATSLTAIAEALGCDNRTAAQRVFNTVRAGILDAKRDGRSVDYASLRVAKRGKELLAATSTKVTVPSRAATLPSKAAKARALPPAPIDKFFAMREAPVTPAAEARVVGPDVFARLRACLAELADLASQMGSAPTLTGLFNEAFARTSPVAPYATVDAPPVAPAPRQRARKAAPAPAPKRARRAAPKVEEEVGEEPLYRTETKTGEELAEFTTLEGAERALGVDRRANRIVEIASGEIVKQKGRVRALPSDEEE